jgi:hypothetical protein
VLQPSVWQQDYSRFNQEQLGLLHAAQDECVPAK